MLSINYFKCSLIQPISKDIAEGLTKVLSQLCHKKGIKFLLTASGTDDNFFSNIMILGLFS